MTLLSLDRVLVKARGPRAAAKQARGPSAADRQARGPKNAENF